MTSFIITDIAHGLTGLPDKFARFTGSIRVENGIISEIGDLAPRLDEAQVSARGCVVCPGFVNTHHHLFQSAMKSVPGAINSGLDQWVLEAPYTFWPQLDERAMEISVLIGLVELALSGTTTVADQHYIFSSRYDYDPAEVLIRVANKFGMRFMLGRGGLTHGRPWHRDGLPPPPTETVDQICLGLEYAAKRWHDPSPFAMSKVAAAPVTTVFNLGEGESREIAAAARSLGLRLHTHLSENDTYVEATLKKFGMRPVEWMAEQGWTGPDVWFAHLVKCSDSELQLLAETGTSMAHCPQSNARLGSGVARAPEFARMGGNVSLAVDGTAANEAGDMAQALYAAFTMHRAVGQPNSTSAETVLGWATAGGAKALGFDGVGTIEVGKAADIVLLDLDHPRYFGQHDLTISPIISGGQFNIRRSYVAGNELVVNGKIPWLDLESLREEAQKVVSRMVKGRSN